MRIQKLVFLVWELESNPGVAWWLGGLRRRQRVYFSPFNMWI